MSVSAISCGGMKCRFEWSSRGDVNTVGLVQDGRFGACIYMPLSLLHVGAESAILPTMDGVNYCMLELSALNLYRALAPRRAAAHPTSDSPRPV